MAKHADRILDHADEYDGIQEYANPLPRWWLAILWGSIVWSPLYMGYHHLLPGNTQGSRYEAEMTAAAERWPAVDPVALAAEMASSPDVVVEGRKIYAQNCVACHGADMGGGIGPNLKDGTWIHGGALDQITSVVTNGVLEKGMLAWGPILGPQQVAKVSAYVHAVANGDAAL